jgi:hypothetical protein
MRTYVWLALAVGTLLLVSPNPVEGYLGPGGVVSGLGAVLALAGAVVAALFGFLWFPIKRIARRLRGAEGRPGEGIPSPSE